MSYIILIPAYNPNRQMIELVRELSGSDARAILIVNDGSAPEHDPIFAEAATLRNVTVLKNAVNLGKGAALHLGINHAVREYRGCTGIVTADADGQHRPSDIVKVAAALEENPASLVLGVRAFTGEIPFRSRFGNSLTRSLVRLIVGLSIQDTQTGLRGIPTRIVPEILKIKTKRYEFELEMLIQCKRIKCPIVQVPIETVYLDDNKSSHFHPIADSAKIYFVLLKFIMASVLRKGRVG